jgi:Tat protein translocase TatB subunit
MEVFGVGPGELLLILVLALVVLGPERLPEVASQLGRTVAALRRMSAQLTVELQRSLADAAQERESTPAAPPALGHGAFCPQCGSPHEAAARYCTHCGSRLGPPDGARPA